MDTVQLAYDMCRSYVLDEQLMPDDERNRILGWIRSRHLNALCTYGDICQDVYYSLDEIRYRRQISAFFKKNAAFVSDECSKVAEESFFYNEELCLQTNYRLDDYDFDCSSHINGRIRKAQHFIEQVLGPFEEFLPEIPSLIRLTNGATSTSSRRLSAPHNKLRIRNLAATKAAQPVLNSIFKYYGVPKVSYDTVLANRVETVPKNWKTERTIACEPTGNLPVQLACGSFIRKRLRHFGVNLNDQSENQKRAYEGSINNRFATIDLSAASDTLSINTVYALLPLPWAEFLNSIRSKLGHGFGKTFIYSKFSSMGNGFTFELESLIFSALVYGASGSLRKNKSCIYGDDIIIPTIHYSNVVELLNLFGFTTNEEKSFHKGPFRESCGKEYYSGVDVTPIYLRGKSFGKPELCHVINSFTALCSPDSHLGKLLSKIISSNNLPKVPYQENTQCGVWVHPLDANIGKTKLITTKHQIPGFYAIISKGSNTFIRDCRTYYLWHVNALNRSTENTDTTVPWLSHYVDKQEKRSFGSLIRSSLVPAIRHKYVRKWVPWHMPRGVLPDHIYIWSEHIINT